MISYELARKLKENGLEGNFDTDTIILHPDCADMPNNCENSAHSSGDCYIIAQCPPTLEELIEACIQIDDKINISHEYDGLGWKVKSGWYCEEDDSLMSTGMCDFEFVRSGNTLDELVAHLWLDLNEKKDE